MTPRPHATAPLLRMRSITKRFPGVVALDGVDLSLGAGEVVALIGENGAGKSTLMKVLGGIHRPDAGTIEVDGRRRRFTSVHDALQCGISVIHQELNLADNLDIAGNIFLGREPIANGLLRTIDRQAMNARTARLLSKVGLNRAPTTPMTRLSTGESQLVEIAKALSADARIVVMDEPTSSLSLREAELLFTVIKGLTAHGIGVLYISHRLAEIRRVADRVVVLRDGRRVGALSRDEASEDAMIQLMIGRDIGDFFPKSHKPPGRVVLTVEGLRHREGAAPVNFDLRAGEILGFAGLVGAGRTEVMRSIFGVDPILDGRIEVKGRPGRICNVMDAIDHGIAMVPEDRKLQGLILEMTVQENIALAGLRQMSRWGFMNRRAQRALALEHFEKLNIKARHPRQRALDLSGGNQQKVVLAKWLALKPKILILDEPTRGVDIHSKTEIYQIMSALTDAGTGIMMVSSEMEEILGVSDRIAVMRGGSIQAVLERPEFSEELVMNLASGRTRAGASS